MVTVLAEIVAGPDFTLKVTGKLLEEVGAVTAKGASPKVLLPMLVKDPIVWAPFETVKFVVTSEAALYFASPAWLAATATLPTPVIVMLLPEIVAGPDFTLKVTGKLLEEVGAVTAKGASPKVLLPMLVKDPIVWAPFETVKFVVTSEAAL
jgi:hypothetical protein